MYLDTRRESPAFTQCFDRGMCPSVLFVQKENRSASQNHPSCSEQVNIILYSIITFALCDNVFTYDILKISKLNS